MTTCGSVWVLAATQDALGRVTGYGYDGLAQTRVITDALNQTTLFSRRSAIPRAGSRATSTDVLGRVTHSYYDPLGRISKRVRNEGGSVAPANVTTQDAYDVLGDTTVIADALNYTQTLSYNPAGWLTARSDATGRVWSFTHDGRGAQLDQIDGLGHAQHMVYDALARPVQAIRNWVSGGSAPDQNLTTTTGYDAAGRPISRTAPDGRQTADTLDGLDRLTTATLNAGGTLAPANVATGYSYDRLDHLTVITNARGYTQTRAYNAAGWLLGTTDGLGQAANYSYDRAGRRIGQSDGRNLPVSTSYDARDAVLTVTAASLVPVTVRYDAAGRRTSLSDETGTTAYTAYDGLDRVLELGQPGVDTLHYAYDALGQRTNVSPKFGPSWDYSYDGAGRLTVLKRNGAKQASAAYDGAGRLQTLALANSTTTTYSYDGADRLTRLSTPLSDFQYGLNPLGQATVVTETLGAATRTVGYGYDGLARVLTATESAGRVYTYTYDLAGNRTSVGVGGTTTSYSYNAGERTTAMIKPIGYGAWASGATPTTAMGYA